MLDTERALILDESPNRVKRFHDMAARSGFLSFHSFAHGLTVAEAGRGRGIEGEEKAKL